jgi:hypothetical protein
LSLSAIAGPCVVRSSYADETFAVRSSEVETATVTANAQLHDALTGQHLTFLQSGQGEARFVLEVRPARRMEMAMRALFRVPGLLRPFARLRR